ncbi:excise [Gordonia phage Hibiscus]
MTSTHNEMLTRDVSERLRVTPSAVSRMVKRGELKPLRRIPTGRAGVFVFDRRDIEKYEKRRDARAERAAARKASA